MIDEVQSWNATPLVFSLFDGKQLLNLNSGDVKNAILPSISSLPYSHVKKEHFSK
jgi:hypothetical protein